ncbi:MAG: ferritin-like domain-containing protein, partial [Bdellovibrionaceae bacterium]|nr:ferritin-like domain-containing protein [Pseudobdellovibrionaceae bacterium]
MLPVLMTANVFQKIEELPRLLTEVLNRPQSLPSVPTSPARDVKVLPLHQHPPKEGFTQRSGRARLLHDLANIELQAMELGLRTLLEFPHAPQQFREELGELTLSEGQHLRLCLE